MKSFRKVFKRFPSVQQRSQKFERALNRVSTWPEITDIINILLYPQSAYHFEHDLIRNSKLYYAMIKIAKLRGFAICPDSYKQIEAE